jgi:phosphatidylserine/phosphatidylglycerophosphate/cardiolipin synthase-like enzyme
MRAVKHLAIKHFISAFIVASVAAAPAFAACSNATVDVCFRPGQVSCQAEIVKTIGEAKTSLLVQAYGFTDTAIIHAIGEAQRRGVQVRAILDKENRQPRYTGATYLHNAGIPVRIDDRVAIAHNKVMVIDGETVIGGSYNYTKSAEGKNAENVTFTKSACVANLYRDNFERRWNAAAPVG